MNLWQLRTFVGVAKELHFGKAAAALNTTQQAVSLAIQRLETELNVRLFDRTTRQVKLTEAGRAFLSQAVIGLNRIDRGLEAARRIERGQGDRIVIGYTGTALFRLFSEILCRYRRLYPEIEIAMRQEAPPKIFRSLRAGELDAVFTHPIGDLQKLKIDYLTADQLVLIMPRGHRFETLENVTASDMASENLIGFLRESNDTDEEPVGALLRAAGYDSKVTQLAESSSGVIDLVSIGLGVSIGLESAAKERARDVSYRHLATDNVAMDHVFATRNVDQSSAVARLREVVLDCTVEASKASKTHIIQKGAARGSRRDGRDTLALSETLPQSAQQSERRVPLI